MAVPVVQQARIDELRRARWRATGLLVVVLVVFLIVVATTEDVGATGYVRAALEAALVGGLADWFAVTAIFRRPLGLPIPHTAVIVERKDAFGETLGQFVQEYFLNTQIVTDRVAAMGVADRATSWLLAGGNPEKVAGYAAELVVRLADVVRDDEVVHLAERELRSRIEQVDTAPLAGRLLAAATDDGRHRELVDAMLHAVERFLADNEEMLRHRFTEEAPWWLPETVDNRIFDRLLTGVRAVLRGETVGGRDELRLRIDGVFADVVERLQHDPVWIARVDATIAELLDHPELRRFLESLWQDLKAAVRHQASDDGSELRVRLAAAVRSVTERVRVNDTAMAQFDRVAVRAVATVTDQFEDEITSLIAGTISRWDGAETAQRLELLLGRDLQFIRINGTVVGGLAGLVIHAVADIAG